MFKSIKDEFYFFLEEVLGVTTKRIAEAERRKATLKVWARLEAEDKKKREHNLRMCGMEYVTKVVYLSAEDCYSLTPEQRQEYKDKGIYIQNAAAHAH